MVLPLVAVWYFRHPLIGLVLAAGIVLVWRELAHHPDLLAGRLGAGLGSHAERRLDLFYANQFPAGPLRSPPE